MNKKQPSFEYQLIDSGDFRKYERVGEFYLIRPATQAVWSPRIKNWPKPDAEFERFAGGDGKWTLNNKNLPESWKIKTSTHGFVIRLTDFGHLGIFPEQNQMWEKLNHFITEKKVKTVLNLFAYTGGSTLAAATAHAEVVHLDASKTSVNWAKENKEECSTDLKIRWIVDDVTKFCEREVRRGNSYEGIILDPPSFGRGPNREAWQIEKHLITLLDLLKKLQSETFKFILLSSHSHGYTPCALENLLGDFHKSLRLTSGEMTVQHLDDPRLLPSGAYCFGRI